MSGTPYNMSIFVWPSPVGKSPRTHKRLVTSCLTKFRRFVFNRGYEYRFVNECPRTDERCSLGGVNACDVSFKLEEDINYEDAANSTWFSLDEPEEETKCLLDHPVGVA